MSISSGLVLKTLGGLGATAITGVGGWWLLTDEKGKLTDWDKNLLELVNGIEKIKISSEPASEKELKISISPSTDDQSVELKDSKKQVTVGVEIKHKANENDSNSIIGKTWKCEINLNLPTGKTTGKLDTNAKPVEKIKKFLSAETDNKELTDSGSPAKVVVIENIKKFINHCVNNRSEKIIPSGNEIKSSIEFFLKEKTNETGTYELPENFNDLFDSSEKSNK